MEYQDYFVINIPADGHVEVDEEDADDTFYAVTIPRLILRYLAARMEESSYRILIAENPNVIEEYKHAVQEERDHYISLRAMPDNESEVSHALVHFFPDSSGLSFAIASSLVERLGKITTETSVTFFDGVLYKEEEPVSKESIPSTILSLHLGNDLLCEYNENPDRFIAKISDALFYALEENCDEEDCSLDYSTVDLREFAD